MYKRNRWSPALVVVGIVAMLVGLVDPLEGSFVILPGSFILTVGAFLSPTKYRKLIAWSTLLVVAGIGAMFGWSGMRGALGAIERSNWLWVALAPYPVGVILGITGGILRLREKPPAPASSDVPPDLG